MRMPKISKATESAAPQSFDFEAAMSELEGVVTRLESGEVSLEEALGAFERGVSLTRACQAALTAAEQKVEKLSVQPDGTARLEPFDDADA
jgi:exodeoxyribonuclease VII small subunit